jgi:hypothetical protein
LFEDTDEIDYQALQHKTLKGFVEQFD